MAVKTDTDLNAQFDQIKNETQEQGNTKLRIYNALKDLFDTVISKIFSGSYNDLTNVPTSFPPSAHNHPITDVVDLEYELGNLDQRIDTLEQNPSGGTLYDTTGQNTDGAMHQKAVTDFVGLLASLTTGVKTSIVAAINWLYNLVLAPKISISFTISNAKAWFLMDRKVAFTLVNSDSIATTKYYVYVSGVSKGERTTIAGLNTDIAALTTSEAANYKVVIVVTLSAGEGGMLLDSALI